MKKINSKLLEHSDIFLKNTEILFEKQKWSDEYKEWFLIQKLKSNSDYHNEHIYELLYKYPSLNGQFVGVRKLMENKFEMVFPTYLQERLFELRDLAFNYYTFKDHESRLKFISIAKETSYTDTVVRYFKIALDAHKAVADILLEHEQNKDLALKATNYASNIYVKCGSECIKNIEKINKLSFIKSESKSSEISRLLTLDESKTLEFKSSLTHDIKKDNQNKDLAKSCLKTIAAFLNSDGGVLLVGVNDDKQIIGLNTEIERYHQNSSDKFLLYWTDILTQKLGKEFGSIIHYDLENINGAYVLYVECLKSSIPCFYDRNEFFIRFNPSTHKLNKNEQIEYIKTRF